MRRIATIDKGLHVYPYHVHQPCLFPSIECRPSSTLRFVRTGLPWIGQKYFRGWIGYSAVPGIC